MGVKGRLVKLTQEVWDGLEPSIRDCVELDGLLLSTPLVLDSWDNTNDYCLSKFYCPFQAESDRVLHYCMKMGKTYYVK